MSKKLSTIPITTVWIPDLRSVFEGANHQLMQEFQSDLTGKLLTLVDAMMSDEIQRKAFKDLVKQNLQDTFGKARQAHSNLIWQLAKEIGDVESDGFSGSRSLEDYPGWLNTSGVGFKYTRTLK